MIFAIVQRKCLCCGGERPYHNGYCFGCAVAYCKASRAWGGGCAKGKKTILAK